MDIIKIVRTKNRIKLSYLISGFALIFLLAGTILPASAGIGASRELSHGTVYAGGNFIVTVHIRADQQVEALTLNETLPEGWHLTQVGNDGATFQNISTFKESTQEWIWVENLSAGEEKTIMYEVNVPSTSKLGTSIISGTFSAYSIPPSPVGGSSKITVNYPLPEAEFSASPPSGTAPLTVQFTDLSASNPNSWEWDFDGNGIIDSLDRNPSHTYENPGTYTVILRATNSTYGNDTEIKNGYITVTEKLSSSGGGGGSSGGIVGGRRWGRLTSPESSRNMNLRKSQISRSSKEFTPATPLKTE